MKRAEKPTAAFVLALIGGTLTLVETLINISKFGLLATLYLGEPLARIYAAGVLGLAGSIMVLISAFMLYTKPTYNIICGFLIIFFSVFALPGVFYGFAIGIILGIVGGALGITWKLPKRTPPPTSAPPIRTCPRCGGAIPEGVKLCPHCGKDLARPRLGPTSFRP